VGNLSADQQAIEAWLSEYARKPNTLRAYAREARRFWLWWSSAQQSRSLQSFSRSDLNDYLALLSAPPAHWLAGNNPKEWRPLKAPLSPASKRQALIILQSLFEHLVCAGHLANNPVRLVRDKGPCPARAHRSIPSQTSMELVASWAHGLVATDSAAQRRYLRLYSVWQWIYWTGARRHELTQATLGNLHCTHHAGSTRWWWQLSGKGEHLARIPLNPQAVATVLSSVGCSEFELPALIRSHPGQALFSAQRGQARSIEVTQIYESVRGLARAAQQHAKTIGLDEQEALMIGSTRPHSLRAYRATHLFNAGVDARHVQRFMRHADFNTTLIYDHTREEVFHDAIVGTA
jgi:integrase/recombinase XerC